MPVVSVLMPFHRHSPHLRPAVRSLLGQTFADWELLLVDNGTGLGVQPLGEDGRDPRIRLVSLPANAGISGGRNAGLARARGEFIALLDYDDIARPTRLERQVAALRADPRLGLVSSRAAQMDDSGTVTGRQFALLDEPEQRTFSNYTMPAPTSSYTGRREFFERFPFRPVFDLAEDFDFLTRVVEVTSVRGVPETLIHYRHHASQSTNLQTAAQVLRACIVRLVTARRRAGRTEALEALTGGLGDWMKEAPTVAQAYEFFAGQCRREGFGPLAAYHARKMVAARRDVATATRAARHLAGALALPRAAVSLRLFFTGPLRTHGLAPA
jgi:glycosyltransferase involved in cell wall biosynthesis